MKGMVFIEMLNMVKSIYGEDMIDDVLGDCNLLSKGAYTSGGTYQNWEILEIVRSLSKKTDLSAQDIIHSFGHYLFSRFYEMMPQFFVEPKNTFDFLETVDGIIHVEVKKIYPEAVLPKFLSKRIDNTHLEFIYKSNCPFSDLAEGLIAGCIDHFREVISIESEDKNCDGQYSRIFRLVRHDS